MIQYSSINDAWGNKEMYKKNTLNNIDNFSNKSIMNEPQKKEQKEQLSQLPQEPIETKPAVDTNQILSNNNPVINKIKLLNSSEHFDTSTTRPLSPCSFAEHFKTCEYCRNSFGEYFNNDNSIANIDIFGLHIKITKDVLKVIFVIIIVLIFIILLSTINISLKDTTTHMKYYMLPQTSNMPYFSH